MASELILMLTSLFIFRSMKSINYSKILIVAFLISSVLALKSCDNNIDEQIAVTFGPVFYNSTSEASAQPVPITLNFSLPLYEDAQIKISVKSNGAIYGTDYTTNPPELVAGEIIILAKTGSTSASFSVTPVDNDIFTNGSSLNFNVSGLNGILKSSVGNEFIFEIIDDDTPPVLVDIIFDGCTEFEVPKPFFQEFVPDFKTDRGWNCRPFGLSNEGVQASAFGGDPGSDNAWLLLNMDSVDLNAGGKLDLSVLTSFYFKLYVESFFDGPGIISLKYSFDYPGSGNPEESTWIDVTEFDSQLPAPGSGSAAADGLFVPVFVSLNGMTGQQGVYLALQFEGGASSNSSSWTIDDLQFFGE